MFDFIKTTSVVPEVSVGNVYKNRDGIIAAIDRCADSDVTVFPELALTGYTCGDLFFQKPLLCETQKALYDIVRHTKNVKTVAVVGLPLEIGGNLFNCAAVVSGGRLCGLVPKTYLPNYNEFYEKRWFSSGSVTDRKTVCTGELGFDEKYDVPFGGGLVFNIGGEFKFGVEICEDMWSPIPPGTFLCLAGAELIVNLSASNETTGKREYRKSVVMQQSARCLCTYCYTSAGSSESTTDNVFSGHCLVAENGVIVAENNKYIDSGYELSCETDLGKIRADRLKIKNFSDSCAMYKTEMSCRDIFIEKQDSGSSGEQCSINPLPFIPKTKTQRLKRCMDIFDMQVSGLKKRVTVTGSKLVVGVSGGLDSTLALLVSAQTMRELGRSAKDVIAVTMPCFGTTDRTFNNSVALMQSLGTTALNINIKAACEQHFADIGHDESVHDVTYENTQARERTQVLMDIANKNGAMVVGTGDLSELALGWCTYNGDHMSMYAVNSGIPKTLIRWMIDSLISNNIFEKSTDILVDITNTPISPELLPPDENGKILQKTEEVVGPYELHDFFLYNMLRYGFSPSKIYFLANKAFAGQFDSKTVLKWLKTFYRRFFTQQYKRSCIPDGVKIGSISLSPRGDWRMPSDAAADLWIDEIEKL